MSKEIDQKVVEMRFDNKHFEQNVNTTLSSIRKLEESCKFKGATKGFEDLDKSAKKVDMTHLGKGLDTVQAKFSALQVIGTTALVNITNSAINMGKKMVSALTIDPVKTGFQEYETQMNAVQTILANTASKGSTLKDVNQALDELNTYADKTIYNFTEMTRNIGTFTAAGIDLETSVNSIQGIANLAAVSGSTSQQASTAMYQLSQALAAGTVKLMDWNSVVNAGMGGEMFQNALKETSKELGTGAEAAIKASGSFRESLKDGWLTAEVLTQTLKKFTTSGANEYVAKYTGLSTEAVEAALKEAEARYGEADAIEKASEALAKKSGKNKDEIKSALQFAKNAEDAATKVKTFSQLWDVMKESAQSGWAQTWKLIIGDFEEAKNLLTPLAEFFTGIIGKMNDARNKLLEGALGKTFTKLSEQIRTIVDPVKSATESVNGIVTTLKDYNKLADEIIAGKWGNAPTRWQDLAKAGYDWAHAQNLVNEKLGDSTRHATKYKEAQKGATEADKSATAAKTELTKADAKSLEMLCALSDEELRKKGLDEGQIKALRQLQKEADKLGMSVKDFVLNIDELDGRTILINSFKNIGQGLVKTFKAMADAWKEIFPPMTSNQLYNIIAGFHKLSTNFKMSDETADNLKRTFKGLFAILDIVLTVISGPIKIAFKIFGQLLSAADVDIFWLTAKIGDAIVKFRDWLDSVLDFTGIFKKMMPHLQSGIAAVKEWFASLKDSESVQKLIKIFERLGEIIKSFITGTDLSGAGSDIISGLVKGLKNGVSSVVSTLGNIAKNIIDTICDILGIKSPSRVMIAIGGFIIAGLIKGLVTGEANLWTNLKELGSSLITFFENMLGDIGGSLKKFELPQIKLDHIIAVGSIIGIVVAAKKVLGVFEMFGKAAEGFGEACSGAGDLMSAFADRISPKKSKFEEVADSVLKMSISVGILAASVYALAQLKTTQLWNAVGAVAALAGVVIALAVAAKLVGGADGSLGKLALTLFGISLAVGTMAGAMKKLEFLTEDNIGPIKEGLMLVGRLIAGFIGISKIPVDTTGMLGTLVGVSIAMLVMAKVIKTMGTMDKATIDQGFVCIAAFATVIGVLMAINKIPGAGSAGLGAMFAGIALALLSMVAVVKLMGDMDVSEIKRGYQCIAAFALIIGVLMLVNKIPGGGSKGLVGMFIGVSVALLAMSACVKILGGMDRTALEQGIECVVIFAGLIGILMTVAKIPGDTKGLTGTLLSISIAIAVLAGIAVIMSLMSPEGLIKGVGAVTVLGIVMAILINVTKNAQKCAGTIWAITAAIAVLVGAIYLLSKIQTDALIGASIAIGSLMGIMAIVIRVAGKASGAMGNIIAMTVAIGVLAGALWLIAGLPIPNALTAAVGLGILMVALVASMNLLQGVQNVSVNALAALGIMVLVIQVAGHAIKQIASLPIANALAGAAALSVLMLSLSVSMMLISNVGAGAIAGAAALIIIAGALAILTPCLQTLGSMPLAQIGTGLLGLAGAFAVIGVAGLLLGPITPMILALSVGIAAIGVGCMAAGVGLMTFSLGLQTLVMMGPAGAAAVTLLVTTILNLIPMIAVALANGIVQFATTIAAGAVTLATAIVTVVNAIITALVGTIPNLLAAAGVLLTAFLNFIVSYIPKMVDAGMKLIKGILQGIADNIGGIVKAAIDIVVNFIKAVSSKIGDVIDAAIKLMISFINGLANGIRNNTGSMISAIDNLMDAVIGAVKKYFSHFAGKGKELIGKMIDGVKSKFSSFKGAAKDMMEGFIKGVKEKFGAIKKAATDAIKGAVDGVKSFLGIKSPSRVFMKIGRYTDEGFALGLKKYAKLGVTAAKNMGEGALEGLKDVLGVNSPATEGIDVGAFLTEGFAIGIEKLSGVVAEAGKNVGSVATKAIGEGIKKDMSAEEQAKKKADNIANAFKTKFDEIDREGKKLDLELELGSISEGEHLEKSIKLQGDRVANAWEEYQTKIATLGEESEHTKTAYNAYLQELVDLNQFRKEDAQKALEERDDILDRAEQINDLEYEIWAKQNEETATESQKAAANINMLTRQYNISLERLNNAQADYANSAGKSAAEIENARIAMLEAQSAFIDAQKNLTTAQEDETKRQQKALIEYVRYKNQYAKALAEMGLSNEEIEAAARKSSGYNPNAESTSKIAEAGTSVVNTFGDAIQNGDTEGLNSAVVTMVTTCADKIKEQRPTWVEGGKFLVEGFVQGIREKIEAAARAAAEMAAAAYSAAQQEIDSHSPSRKFAELGRFVDMGFAQGITKYARVASDATSKLGETAINSMLNSISSISNMANSDIDVIPRIRPVIDSSSMRGSIGQINGIFGQRTMELATINAGMVRTDMDNLSSMVSRLEALNDSGNSNIVNAIGNLRGDFGSLVKAIGGMHIRMDSGTVVGELINKIDGQLGRIANHKGRGN